MPRFAPVTIPAMSIPSIEQMRKMRHDEAVFDSAGLALIGIADDIFDRIGFLADEIPLHARGKTCATHAPQFRGFELSEDVVKGARLNELSDNAIFFRVRVRIGFAFHAGLRWMRLVDVFTADRTPRELFGMIGSDVRKNVIVDGDSGSVIAAAEAGNVANLDVIGARTCEAALEIGAQLAGAVEDGSSCPRTRESPLSPAEQDENADRNSRRCESGRAASGCVVKGLPVPLLARSRSAAGWPVGRRRSRRPVLRE